MKRLLLLIPLGVLIMFFYTPLLVIVKEAFYNNGSIGLTNFCELLSSSYHRQVILFTLKQSLVSLFFTLLIGIPAAYVFTHYKFPGRKLLQPIILIPFVLPSIIVVLGFILLYGQNGYLNRLLSPFNINLKILYRFEAIVLAHTFYNFPIVLKMVGDAWQRLNNNYLKAAQTLGSNRIQTFFRITLPSLFPSIINASFLVFTYCFMSFGIVLVLGSVKYTTIEVNVYFLINSMFQLPMAMALGAIQLLFSLVFLIVSNSMGHYSLRFINLLDVVPGQGYRENLFSFRGVGVLKVVSKAIVVLFLLLLIIIISGPILVLFVYGLESNLTEVISLANLKESVFGVNRLIGTSIFQSILNSILLATLAGLSSLVLSFLFTQSMSLFKDNGKKNRLVHLIEVLITVPLFVSPITISLGYQKIIQQNHWSLNRFYLLLAIHTIITLPFVFRILSQALENISQAQLDAARTLGANTYKVFVSLVVPQLKRSIILAFSFAFALSFGEFGAVLMIDRSYVTIPVAIYRFIGARRLTNGINVSFILLLTTFAFFFLMETMSEKKSS
jgi:thiamine transport system permease protein